MVATLVVATVSTSFAKALNPLQGDFEPEQVTAKVGEIVELVLVIDPLTSFESVALTLDVPPGLKLLEGRTAEVLKGLKAGEKITRRFRFRVLDVAQQEIWLAAAVQGLPGDSVIRRVYYAVINKVEKKPYPVKKDKNGREMIVIPVPTD